MPQAEATRMEAAGRLCQEGATGWTDPLVATEEARALSTMIGIGCRMMMGWLRMSTETLTCMLAGGREARQVWEVTRGEDRGVP